MQDLFVFEPGANPLDMKEGIQERLHKTRAVFSLLFSLAQMKGETISPLWNSVYYALSAADGFLEEVEMIFAELTCEITVINQG